MDITTGQSKPPVTDVRADKLTKFFDDYKCPSLNYALITKYIERADQDRIQYSLLPSISLAESSCGKRYINNNIYGWGSARVHFNSIEDGLAFVSHQLGSGKYYRGKTLDKKLHSYNSVNPSYGANIKRLMKEIENE